MRIALWQLSERLPMLGYTESAIGSAYRRIMSYLPIALSNKFRGADREYISLKHIIPPNAHLGEIFRQEHAIPVPSLRPTIPDDIWHRM
ncbi:hypothetical protein CXB49_10715 [Chromobacterium sp. ATCC 53434]|nr:hypothetical protein CXB49_10715 [Chromobacterium sp. ATCC 53434]